MKPSPRIWASGPVNPAAWWTTIVSPHGLIARLVTHHVLSHCLNCGGDLCHSGGNFCSRGFDGGGNLFHGRLNGRGQFGGRCLQGRRDFLDG